MSVPGDGGDPPTRTTSVATPVPDEQATRAVESAGIVAELIAVTAAGPKSLSLHALPDQIVIGRGTASQWQIEDVSLSRTHARFEWNGRELTVEDLGSANGTRVGARLAQTPTQVRPGESVQMGTVVVTFELKGPPPLTADGEATAMLSAPTAIAPMPAAPTVVQMPPRALLAQSKPAAPAARGPLPGPRSDRAAALARRANVAVGWVKAAWKRDRRPFFLAGAAAWVGLLLLVWLVSRPPLGQENDVFPAASSAADVRALPSAPGVPAADSNVVGAPRASDPAPSAALAESDDLEARAIGAYDQGHMSEARALFRKLAADPKNGAAKFMVDLIESRSGPAPAP